MFEDQEVRDGVAGTGAPLVLVHGTPFSSVVWRRIAPYLTPHRRVHWFDLLGYGRSEMRAGPGTSRSACRNRVLAALLDHWGPDGPGRRAHDFPGATALRAHLLDGRDYRSLLLIDPVAIKPVGIAVRAGRPRPRGRVGRAARRTSMTRSSARTRRRRAPPAGGRRTCGATSDPRLGETGQAAFYRQVAQMSDRYIDRGGRPLRRDPLPCLHPLGRSRRGGSRSERGEALAARIPGARLQVVPAAGHLMQEDAPEAIVAAALAMLG